MLDKLNLIHQTLLINLLICKTLEEERVRDLPRSSNENQPMKNEERRLQGLGPQQPRIQTANHYSNMV
jgi:hypothetical protein